MLEQYITSFIEGRVRLRHDAFKDAARVAMINQILPGLPGILEVVANSRTGSLLIHYDCDELDRDAVLALLRQGETMLGLQSDAADGECGSLPPTVRETMSPLRWQRSMYMAMLASLGASLAFGLTGRLRPHMLAGSVFVALNAVHMWDRRKYL